MTADGMIGSADGALLFAQEQSNSIRKLWPNGKEWVEWLYIHGAGAVSIDESGRVLAVERTCTDPGLRLPSPCAEATRRGAARPSGKSSPAPSPTGVHWDASTTSQPMDMAGHTLPRPAFTMSPLTVPSPWWQKAAGCSPTVWCSVPTGRRSMSPIAARSSRSTSGRAGRRPTAATSPRWTANSQGGFGGDGLAVDSEGRLYVTADAGVYVFGKDGKKLGIIPVPRRAITIAFSGSDRRVLYVGAMGAVAPDGEPWTTPEGVRNVAMTVYRVPTLARGPEGASEVTFAVFGRRELPHKEPKGGDSEVGIAAFGALLLVGTAQAQVTAPPAPPAPPPPQRPAVPVCAPDPGDPVECRGRNAAEQAPAFPQQTRAPFTPSNVALNVETVAEGLAFPWGLAPLPDGRFLVTEKAGTMRIVSGARCRSRSPDCRKSRCRRFPVSTT